MFKIYMKAQNMHVSHLVPTFTPHYIIMVKSLYSVSMALSTHVYIHNICILVLLVQLVLPLQLPSHGHAVVPDDL